MKRQSILPFFYLALGLLTLSIFSHPAAADPVNEIDAIAGKDWTLASLKLGGMAVDISKAKALTLKLTEEGKASGKSAVNRYFGSIKLDGAGGCEWSKGFGATRMAGPPAMMDIERSYFQALPKTTKVALQDGALTFTSKDGESSAVFTSGKNAGSTLDGQVVFKGEKALPKNAKVKVSLQDTSLADAKAVVLGTSNIADATEFPIKFKIPYDKDKIQKGRTYTLSARIEVGGKLHFINDTSHRVFRDGNTEKNPVDVAVIKIR